MAAQKKLVLSYQRLIAKLAREAAKRTGVDAASLVADGNIGLIASIKTFDPEKGAFTNHAYAAIKWYMHTAQREDQLVRIPRTAWSQEGGMPSYALREAVSVEDLTNPSSGEAKNIDTMEFFTEEPPDEDAEDAKKMIGKLLESGVLSEREKRVLQEYYFEEKTFREIGDRLGVSTSRAEAILKTAILKSRAYLSPGNTIRRDTSLPTTPRRRNRMRRREQASETPSYSI